MSVVKHYYQLKLEHIVIPQTGNAYIVPGDTVIVQSAAQCEELGTVEQAKSICSKNFELLSEVSKDIIRSTKLTTF